MARPLAGGKTAVDLVGGPRKVGSRIRRDPPPPPPKKLTAGEMREREKWVVVTGIVAVALALAVIILSVGRWSGWSPAQTVIRIEERR
jgi:cytochrome c-type biogenesis protein CcmH/NrfG